MTIAEQLLDAASKLTYYDECEGKAVSAFRGHLRMIAAKVPELEAAGFEVKADLTPRHLGGAKVWLTRNGITAEIYSEFYDRYCRGFFDEKRRPLENLLELVLKVAQMFAPAA